MFYAQNIKMSFKKLLASKINLAKVQGTKSTQEIKCISTY